MNRNTERMRRVVAIAAAEERREGIELGKSQRALDAERDRADELTAYRQSYAERPTPDGSVDALRWHDYQNFLQRLDQACDMQVQVVRDTQRNVDVHRARWLVKRQRLQSLEQVVARHLDVQRHDDERRLQKAIDDLPAYRDSYAGAEDSADLA